MDIILALILILILLAISLPFKIGKIGPAIRYARSGHVVLRTLWGKPDTLFGPGFVWGPLFVAETFDYAVFPQPLRDQDAEQTADQDTVILTLPCKGGSNIRLHISMWRQINFDINAPLDDPENWRRVVAAWTSNSDHDPGLLLDDLMQNLLTKRLLQHNWEEISSGGLLAVIEQEVSAALNDAADAVGCKVRFLIKDWDPPTYVEAVAEKDAQTQAEVRQRTAYSEQEIAAYRAEQEAEGPDWRFKEALQMIQATFKNATTVTFLGDIFGTLGLPMALRDMLQGRQEQPPAKIVDPRKE